MPTAATILAVDWTPVFVAGVTSLFGAVPATIAAIAALRNRRDMKLPSGGRIGEAVERTSHLAEVNAAHIINVQDHIRRTSGENPTTSPPP